MSQATPADPSGGASEPQHTNPSQHADADPLGLGNPQPDAGIGHVADSVLAEVKDRAGQGGSAQAQGEPGDGPQPEPGQPAGQVKDQTGKNARKKWSGWKREPIDNFERDWQGNVKKHKNGRPVRKKGKRREAQPGDTLADGTVYQPEGQGQAQGVHDPTQAQPAQAPTAGRVHPELGRKLADVATKVAGRIGGEDWQFDQTERDILAEATSDATGGVRMPGWAVFVIVVGVVIAPRMVKTWAKAQRKQTENQRSKGKQANGRDNAPAERGPDHDGQNVNRQAVGFSYD